MKIKRLQARGFIGFKRGLGLDEVTVDLSSLDGLVALTGDNGKGKTTLLELLTPYRQLASRNANLKNHVFLRDSFKELTLDHSGHEYRMLVKIDCDSDRSEGFIFKDGQSIVNGKVREYDKAINEIFGSPELFFSSVFCAQNARKLSDMRTGELKDLFSEFLRLDKLEAYEQTAKQAGAIVGGMVVGREREASMLLGYDIAGLEAQQAENAEGLNAATVSISMADMLILQHTDDLETARTAANGNAVIIQKIEGLRSELKNLEQRRDEDRDKSDRELNDLRTKCQAAMIELQKAEGLAARAGEIEVAGVEAETIRAAQAAFEDEVHDADMILDKVLFSISALEKDIAAARQEKALAENDSSENVLAIQARRSREAMAVLEQRSPICNDPTCPLIAAAVEASELLPEIEKDIEELKARNATRISDMNAELFSFGCVLDKRKQEKADAVEKKTAAQAKIKTGSIRLADLEKTLSLRADIAAAVERKSSIEARIAELKAEGMAKKSDLEQLQKVDAENVARLDDLIKQTEQTLDHSAAGAIMNAEAEIVALKNTKHDAEQQLVSLQAQRESINLKLIGARTAEKKLESLRSDIAALQTEAAEWLYIQNATGKNGLRALEIDGVAPCITNYANSLLSATYGPTFSVRIQTQNDEGKECFDILVCNSDGEETHLDDLSGGQKVWILKALRLAMTLISKEKSTSDFRTAYGDEEDGPLDAGNAQIFVDMYRQFIKSGGFDTFLYISHRPECVGMADHQICFRDNGITIN